MKFLPHSAKTFCVMRSRHSTSIMQFKRMLLMCSALITLAYSFPTGIQHNTTTTLMKNETNILDANKKPLVVIMNEKDPKTDSVVVQFVYTSNGGNSIVESFGTDKDKYAVDYLVHEEKLHQKLNSSDKEKVKSDQIYTNETEQTQNNEPKMESTKVQMRAVTSLMPEEVSPLTGKWPKYMYDAFSPIKPFPELQDGKSNQINTGRLAIENANIYSRYDEKERKEPHFNAGPQLNPLSIYDREFNVPIFS